MLYSVEDLNPYQLSCLVAQLVERSRVYCVRIPPRTCLHFGRAALGVVDLFALPFPLLFTCHKTLQVSHLNPVETLCCGYEGLTGRRFLHMERETSFWSCSLIRSISWSVSNTAGCTDGYYTLVCVRSNQTVEGVD